MKTITRTLFAIATVLCSMPSWAANTPAIKNLDDIDRCAKTYQWDAQTCLDATHAYAKKNPKQQFEIAQRVRLNFVHWAALPFFDAALGKAPNSAQCADADVSLAVLSGLNLPPDHAQKAVAERLFSGACFATLRPAAEKELQSSGPTSYEGQSICSILKAKGMPHAACEVKPQATPTAEPAQLPTVDLAKAQYSLIKVFRGNEGARMTMAEVQGAANVYVLRFDGIRGEWNGKTIVHQLDGSPTQSNKLWTLYNNKRWTTLVTQGTQRTAYVPNALDGMTFWYSEEDSKKASADQLR
jgi:hypothetical protein